MGRVGCRIRSQAQGLLSIGVRWVACSSCSWGWECQRIWAARESVNVDFFYLVLSATITIYRSAFCEVPVAVLLFVVVVATDVNPLTKRIQMLHDCWPWARPLGLSTKHWMSRPGVDSLPFISLSEGRRQRQRKRKPVSSGSRSLSSLDRVLHCLPSPLFLFFACIVSLHYCCCCCCEDDNDDDEVEKGSLAHTHTYTHTQ